MKIPKHQENPLDILNIYFADLLCPLFKKMNMTPNHITTLSLIFGVISIIFMWNYNWLGFAITYYISYFFDCMDGHYARKYNLVSKFGDMYDHVKDVSIIISFCVVVIYRYKLDRKIWIKYITLFMIITFMMISHLGCQEKIYHSDESPTLCLSKILCPGNPYTNIQFSKFGGCGTWTVLFILLALYIKNNRIK